MIKQKMEQKLDFIEIGYKNDCKWLEVAQSTSREGLQYRLQNPQINFHNCRENCPMVVEDGFCQNYSQRLNLVPILQ